MPYSKRVAAWLFGLIVALVKKCGYFSDLEMISFWLLCMKLLRATTGVKRTNGAELTEDCSHTQNDQQNVPDAVSIETSHLSEMATLSGNKMDSMETKKAENKGLPGGLDEEKNDVSADLTKYIEMEKSSETSEVQILDNGEVSVVENLENGDDNSRSVSCEDKALLVVSDSTDLSRTESITSSMSDSPSSTGSVCENKLACKLQETSTHEKNDSSVPVEESEVSQVPEDTEALVVKSESTELNQTESIASCVSDSTLNMKSVCEDVLPCKPQEMLIHEIIDSSVPTEEYEVTKVPEDLETLVIELESTEINQSESMTSSVLDSPSSLENICKNTLACKPQETFSHEKREGSVPTEDSQVPEVPTDTEATWADHDNLDAIQGNPTQQEVDESILEKCIREETSSDISTESCHILDQDDLSDCLQVEMAIVLSDSESDDKWRAIFSSSVNKEDNEIFFDNSQDTITQEHLDQERADSEGNIVDLEQKPEAQIQDCVSNVEQPQSFPECTETQADISHLLTQPLKFSELSEDKVEVAPNLVKHRAYTSQTTKSSMEKKLPSDYCVIQETKSENVSTEHVDFQLARKQWLKMEEQTKQQVLQPTIKQGSCQGGHSLLYTPVRNIEKPKKDPELDSLGLREQAYTQFSPCSEDSGLGDSSYRSPYEDPETSIEREIRIAMEREDSLRRKRGLSKSPSASESLQSRVRPATLVTGKFNRVEERKRSAEFQEDSYRSQRSPSTKTPSFSIPSSPSPKSPSYHEMAANNVIILEPESYSQGPRRYSQGPLSSPGVKKFSEWPSETTNVIILETSNLIIRSASEFCLNKMCQEPQESTFLNNPFFKLRSRSTQSLVDQEIKIVKQRDEELKRQRAQLYAKEKYDTVLVSPTLMDSITFDRAELPVRCKSSPSSPMRTGRKMERFSLSCDQKFTDSFSRVRRKSAMAMRWEAGEFANH